MADQAHWELIFTSLENRLRDVCNSVKQQNQATNEALVQMAGLVHRLDTLEAEVAAMRQRPRMGLHIDRQMIWRAVKIGAILVLLMLNAPESHTGWVLGLLK